jgi:hypothetical protein
MVSVFGWPDPNTWECCRSAKSFRHEQFCLTWYANKKSLLFQGEEGNKLKDLIINCYKIWRTTMPIHANKNLSY